MGWVLLVVTLTVVSICAVAVAKSAPIFTRLQGFIDNMNTRLRESITGVRVIRAFGKEAHERGRLDETFTRLRHQRHPRETWSLPSRTPSRSSL